MRRFLKVSGWIALAALALAACFAWWVFDDASLKAVAVPMIAVAFVYWLVTDLVLNPIRAEFRQLHERLDRIERRLPRDR